jgi:hypothetical protein
MIMMAALMVKAAAVMTMAKTVAVVVTDGKAAADGISEGTLAHN